MRHDSAAPHIRNDVELWLDNREESATYYHLGHCPKVAQVPIGPELRSEGQAAQLDSSVSRYFVKQITRQACAMSDKPLGKLKEAYRASRFSMASMTVLFVGNTTRVQVKIAMRRWELLVGGFEMWGRTAEM